MGLAGEFVSLVDNQHLKRTVFGFNVGDACYLFDHMLDDMPVLVQVVGRGHFDVVVGRKNAKLDGCGSSFRLQDPLFFFQFKDVVSEYFGEEGIGPGFFAGAFWSVEDEMLGGVGGTGKSLVSASWRRTSVTWGW